MLTTASKYGDVRAEARKLKLELQPKAARKTGPGVFVPTMRGARDCLMAWFWRELKDGGWLHSYLRREKGVKTGRDLRRVARLMHGFRQNNKSDFRRLAAIPARLYHRWKTEDEHFWEDDNNLRSLKRDNPDAAIYVGPRKLPNTARRVTAHESHESTRMETAAKGRKEHKEPDPERQRWPTKVADKGALL